MSTVPKGCRVASAAFQLMSLGSGSVSGGIYTNLSVVLERWLPAVAEQVLWSLCSGEINKVLRDCSTQQQISHCIWPLGVIVLQFCGLHNPMSQSVSSLKAPCFTVVSALYQDGCFLSVGVSSWFRPVPFLGSLKLSNFCLSPNSALYFWHQFLFVDFSTSAFQQKQRELFSQCCKKDYVFLFCILLIISWPCRCTFCFAS